MGTDVVESSAARAAAKFVCEGLARHLTCLVGLGRTYVWVKDGQDAEPVRVAVQMKQTWEFHVEVAA